MVRYSVVSLLCTVFVISPLLVADEFADAMHNLCEKQKSCALENIDKKNMTPQMLKMMEPMLENICASLKQQYQSLPPAAYHDVHKIAVSCFNDMSKMSCAALKEGKVNIKSCKQLEEMGKKYQQ